MALFWRIWFAVTLVNLVVLTIFVGLATLQFGNIDAGLVGERLVVLAERTAEPFKAAARIGLPLSSVRNANTLLERARQTDVDILAIHVFDAAGHIVQSTATTPPAMIPAKAIAARAAATGAPWHIEGDESFFSSIDILDRNQSTVGGVLVVYPRSGYVTQVRAMGADLVLATLLILFVSAGIGILLLRLGIGKQIRLFESIDEAVTNFERDARRSPARKVDDDAGTLGHLLDEAESRYLAAGRALGSARQDRP